MVGRLTFCLLHPVHRNLSASRGGRHSSNPNQRRANRGTVRHMAECPQGRVSYSFKDSLRDCLASVVQLSRCSRTESLESINAQIDCNMFRIQGFRRLLQ